GLNPRRTNASLSAFTRSFSTKTPFMPDALWPRQLASHPTLPPLPSSSASWPPALSNSLIRTALYTSHAASLPAIAIILHAVSPDAASFLRRFCSRSKYRFCQPHEQQKQQQWQRYPTR